MVLALCVLRVKRPAAPADHRTSCLFCTLTSSLPARRSVSFMMSRSCDPPQGLRAPHFVGQHCVGVSWYFPPHFQILLVLDF